MVGAGVGVVVVVARMAIADSLVGCSVGITGSIERDILLELFLVEIWGMYIYSGLFSR
jgi:hypothetical protein